MSRGKIWCRQAARCLAGNFAQVGGKMVRLVVSLCSFFLLASCSNTFDTNKWYGLYYQDVTKNYKAALSRPFDNPAQCKAAMRDYLKTAPRFASFACARGCTRGEDGYISLCLEVAR
jgi:hypothetical protein